MQVLFFGTIIANLVGRTLPKWKMFAIKSPIFLMYLGFVKLAAAPLCFVYLKSGDRWHTDVGATGECSEGHTAVPPSACIPGCLPCCCSTCYCSDCITLSRTKAMSIPATAVHFMRATVTCSRVSQFRFHARQSLFASEHCLLDVSPYVCAVCCVLQLHVLSTAHKASITNLCARPHKTKLYDSRQFIACVSFEKMHTTLLCSCSVCECALGIGWLPEHMFLYGSTNMRCT